MNVIENQKKMQREISGLNTRIVAMQKVIAELIAAGGDPNNGVYFGHRLSGQYYTVDSSCGFAPYSNNQTPNNLRAMPFLVPVQTSFDRIACYVSGGTAAGEKLRLGIYKSKADGTPGDLILDSEIVSESVGSKEAVISQTLDPGLYWLIHIGSHDQNLYCLVRADCLPIIGRDSTANIYPSTVWSVAQAYGALPDPFPAGGETKEWSAAVAVFLRKA